MSKYAIRRGHQRTGNDGCAEDILNEIDVVNAYYQYIIDGLKAQGHEVLDVTPPEAYRSLSNSLMYGVNMANNWGADYFISCHANSCDRTDNPVGCEVVYLGGSNIGKSMAENVDSQLANLGLKDRGAKADVRGLCELKRTNCPAIIIEPFFISSQADVDLWNSIGAEKLGNSIVEGLTGQTIQTGWKQGWNKNQTGWFYCTDTTNNYYYKDLDFKEIDGDWYSFDSDGYARQNCWIQSSGKWYYLGEDCKMTTNWKKINGYWYYFNPVSNGIKGAMVSGWFKEGEYQYCTYSSGELITNIDIYSWRFDSNGHATKL